MGNLRLFGLTFFVEGAYIKKATFFFKARKLSVGGEKAASYMFALGIEMDPYAIFKQPSCDAEIADIISTFILGFFTTPFFDFFIGKHKLYFTLCLSTLLASTASPILTRLITSLKISKSDIDKLVIATGMHSEFLCSLLLSIGYITMPLPVFCENEAYQMIDDKEKACIKFSIEMGE